MMHWEKVLSNLSQGLPRSRHPCSVPQMLLEFAEKYSLTVHCTGKVSVKLSFGPSSTSLILALIITLQADELLFVMLSYTMNSGLSALESFT